MVNMGFFVPVNCRDFEDKNNYYRFVNQVEDGPVINEKTVIYDFSVIDINKQMIALSQYKDKVNIVVNVASFWGLTEKNYIQFVELYGKYKSKGLEILAFPCNQFGKQEPGTNEEIKEFVKKIWSDVSFIW